MALPPFATPPWTHSSTSTLPDSLSLPEPDIAQRNLPSVAHAVWYNPTGNSAARAFAPTPFFAATISHAASNRTDSFPWVGSAHRSVVSVVCCVALRGWPGLLWGWQRGTLGRGPGVLPPLPLWCPRARPTAWSQGFHVDRGVLP